MKKLICIALLLVGALSASGQHYIGVKGGYGAAKGLIYPPPVRSEMIWGRYTGGVVWKYFSPLAVFGGISAELEYQQRGYRIFEREGSQPISDSTNYNTKTRTVNTLTLPLVWQPHFYFVNRSVRVYASLGISVSYNLGIGDTFTETEYRMTTERTETASGGFVERRVQTATSVTSPYTMQTARDVRWNYGAVIGGGFGVLAGRFEVFAEGRYYWGMSDILRYRSKYQFHEDNLRDAPLRSELNNIYVTVGVAFRLGKGGILAPPLRRRAAPPSGVDDFRNIKLDF